MRIHRLDKSPRLPLSGVRVDAMRPENAASLHVPAIPHDHAVLLLVRVSLSSTLFTLIWRRVMFRFLS
ncbi:hypothetical protein OH690_05305 [Escherichia coli]|nr:hypothetical protein [Escherichia coli]